MTADRPHRSPGRNRSGLRAVRTHRPSPRPRPVVEDRIRPGAIYKIPVWEIDPQTGFILLYEKRTVPMRDQDTGDVVLRDVDEVVGQVPCLTRPHRGTPRIVHDYVGQTVRGVDVRHGEHAEDKPWEDLIVGPAEIVEQGLWDKQTRDLKEVAAIHVLKPRFNYEHNLDNPHRIKMWRQVELRHARDRAIGRADWVPLEQRTAAALRLVELNTVQAGLDGREPRYPVQIVTDALVAAGRTLWRLPQPIRIGMALALTFAVAAYLLVGLLQSWGWPPWVALGFAVAAAAVLVYMIGSVLPTGRRRRRRTRRR